AVLEQLVDLLAVAREDLAQLVFRGRAAGDERAPDLREQLRRHVHRADERRHRRRRAQIGERVDRRAGDAEEQTVLLLERAGRPVSSKSVMNVALACSGVSGRARLMMIWSMRTGLP